MKALEDIKHEVVFDNGQRYEFIAYKKHIDVSEQNNGIKTVLTHVLKGFEEDLVLVIEDKGVFEESNFYFGKKVGKTGLIVNLTDEEVNQKANELLMRVLDH
jgi:hypothetical protein